MRTWHTTLAAGVFITLMAVAVPCQAQQVTIGNALPHAATTPSSKTTASVGQGTTGGSPSTVGDSGLVQAPVRLARPHCGAKHELCYRRQGQPDQFLHQLQPGLQAVDDHSDAVGHDHERPDGLCVRHVADAVRDQRYSGRGGLPRRAAAVAAGFQHRSQRHRSADPGDVASPCRRPGPGRGPGGCPGPGRRTDPAAAAAAEAEQHGPAAE